MPFFYSSITLFTFFTYEEDGPVKRPQAPLRHTMHSKYSIKTQAPPHPYAVQCHVSVCVCVSCARLQCGTYQLSVAECVFCDAVALWVLR